MTLHIKRNATVPTEAFEIFSTYANNQSGVLIQVFEAVEARTKDNNLPSELNLFDIPPVLRGDPRIEVAVDIDAHGNLNAPAWAKTTIKSDHMATTSDAHLYDAFELCMYTRCVLPWAYELVHELGAMGVPTI